MAFVFASTSAIDRLFEQRALRLQNSQTAGSFASAANPPIRRPYRGIQIKNDTYATMSIVDGAGRVIPLISESATDWPTDNKGKVNTYADFILQAISEERSEKSQIIETFGDSFVFFFGERPRMLNIQGILVNTDDFGWRAQFMENYETRLRGTKLVQRNARLYLAWDTIVVEGYPINLSASENSMDPYTVNFSMQMFLTNYQNFGRIGITEFPKAPVDTQTFDALNRQLNDRDRPITTTTEVRRLNYESRGGRGGLGGFFREGIRGINNITNFVGNAIQTASTLLSGRVVRTPIGVAGFLNQVGVSNPIVGGIGLTGAQFVGLDSLADTLLTIPARPQFAPVDELLLRTQISENVDEYPLLAGESVPSRWSLDEEAAFAARQATREAALTRRTAQLVLERQVAQGEAKALDTVQDVIQFVKTGFAMVNTVRAVAQGGPEVALDAIGLGGVF